MDMWNELEEFTQGASSSRSNVARITLSSRGEISLNQLAYEGLHDAKKVVLAFSSQKGVIGIRPAKEGEAHALEVKKLAKSASFIIRCRAFCNYYQITPKQNLNFNDFITDERGILLDMSKVTLIAPRGKRTGQTSAVVNSVPSQPVAVSTVQVTELEKSVPLWQHNLK